MPETIFSTLVQPNLPSQKSTDAVTVPAKLNSNCKRERSRDVAPAREAQDRRARRSSGRQIRLLGDTTTSQDAHEVRLQGLEDRCQAAGRRCQEATLPISADTEKACSLAAACRLQEAESRERKAAGDGSAPAATGIRGERLRYEQENRQGTLNPS